MIQNNPWIGYLDRSYEQIREKLLAAMGIAAPELTDTSESNPFVVMISFFAGVSEMLNYNIDSNARESFLQTAEMYNSALNIISTLDYRVKANHPEMVDLVFTLNAPAPVQGIIIPINTIVSNGEFQYITTDTVVITEGLLTATVGAKQTSIVANANIGNTNGLANQEFNLGPYYVEGSAFALINNELYTLRNTFAYSNATAKDFIVNIDENKEAIVRFGDGINGVIPPVGKLAYFSFLQTQGPAGAVGRDSLTTIVTPITLPVTYTIEVTNPNASSGGSYVESIEQVRKNAPIHVRSLDRAVTDLDLQQLCELYPGVHAAKPDNTCAKNIDVYIAPTAGTNGGIASQALLDELTSYIDLRKMYGTRIVMKPAGVSTIEIELDVVAKYRRDLSAMSSDVINALTENYGYNNSSINKGIFQSDIYALIDNLDKVNYLTIKSLKLVPYPHPVDHLQQLTWDVAVIGEIMQVDSYVIAYLTSNYSVTRNNVFLGVYGLLDTFDDGFVSFTLDIQPQYVQGMEWSFKTYPTNKDINPIDFSVPIMTTASITVNAFESPTV